MKRTVKNSNENVSFNNFSFEVLTNNEMLKVRGGGDPKPKTRDKDIYDIEEN